MWSDRIGGRWRRRPTGLKRRRRDVLHRRCALTPRHVERGLLSRADARWHRAHQCWWRINRRNVIHQRRAVLGAESQPLIGKLLIAFWAAPHSFGGAATNRRFGPSRPVANTFRNEPAGDETSSRLTALQICSHQLELTKKVRNLDCRIFVRVGTVRSILAN